METCINYCSNECAFVSSDERRWVTVVRKLKEKYPEEVRIIAEPEKNDGCIYATVPVRWVRITPPRQVNLTDEQKQNFADRMKQLRKDS